MFTKCSLKNDRKGTRNLDVLAEWVIYLVTHGYTCITRTEKTTGCRRSFSLSFFNYFMQARHLKEPVYYIFEPWIIFKLIFDFFFVLILIAAANFFWNIAFLHIH
ncbi:hypothetical protein SAMN05216353_10827 [Halobacillus alkaliphilus]|uniref:Uncharacterized protein n=1 Tax=Halobacillus alkaliphilus TaxID=396056 RepID=A0A1I2L950_9BACI|nr:hypothetical protein SAMN05216353_10827 [Halobacillus alkaliphilus]